MLDALRADGITADEVRAQLEPRLPELMR